MKNIYSIYLAFLFLPSPTTHFNYHIIELHIFVIVRVYFIFLCLLGCLSGLCFGLSLIYSPFVMYFCRKKSTRLTGVIGGNILFF